MPGVYGQACFAFDVRAEIGGTGVGTMRDEVFHEVNSQFAVESVTRSGDGYVLQCVIIASRSPQLIGNRLTISAQNLGNGSALCSITVESEEENLVVIAIIAILISLLLPAVH